MRAVYIVEGPCRGNFQRIVEAANANRFGLERSNDNGSGRDIWVVEFDSPYCFLDFEDDLNAAYWAFMDKQDDSRPMFYFWGNEVEEWK